MIGSVFGGLPNRDRNYGRAQETDAPAREIFDVVGRCRTFRVFMSISCPFEWRASGNQ